MRAPWSVYVLRCGDATLYTGIARDVGARLAQHAAGKGARYTRGRGPLDLLVRVPCKDRGEALRLEARIKRLPRDQKLAVIARAQRRPSAIKRALLAPGARAR